MCVNSLELLSKLTHVSKKTADSYLEENEKKYLCAMGIRIARDLMACLPVSEVGVTARKDGKVLMEVTYRREKLLHRNFTYLDPVKLTEECGANFEP